MFFLIDSNGAGRFYIYNPGTQTGTEIGLEVFCIKGLLTEYTVISCSQQSPRNFKRYENSAGITLNCNIESVPLSVGRELMAEHWNTFAGKTIEMVNSIYSGL